MIATVADAAEIAQLLHDFNTEYDEPVPAVDVLADRLRTLLASDDAFAILSGSPAVAVALVMLRPSIWYEGRVALLEELYVVPALRSRGIGAGLIAELTSAARSRGAAMVEINVDELDIDAQRFYVREGFACTDPGSTTRALWYYREL